MNIRRIAMILGVCLVFGGSFYSLFKIQPLEDSAYFGGDTWVYHGIGVNLSRGHGYVLGAEESFETYKFGVDQHTLRTKKSELDQRYRAFQDSRGQFSYYSSPGYPLFLGMIYKIFGISPKAAKLANILLLSLVMASLPLLGARMGQTTGFLAGIGASVFSLKYFTPNPFEIMTEPLIMFGLAAWAFVFLYWQVNPSHKRTMLLGGSFGLLFWIKGLTIFFPFLFAVYCVARFGLRRKAFICIVLFLSMAAITFSPWVIFASTKEKQLTVFEQQGDNVLLDGNNEDTLKNGQWISTWRHEPNNMRYFYNRDAVKKYSAPVKVLKFWKRHLHELPFFFWKKIQTAFYSKGFLITVIGFLLYYLLLPLKLLPEKNLTMVFPMIYFLDLIIITVILFGYGRFTLTFMPFFLLVACYLPLALIQRLIPQAWSNTHNKDSKPSARA